MFKDERNPDWACNVRTKPRNMYDVGQGQGPHDACANCHKSEPLLLNNNHDHDPQDDFKYVQPNLPPTNAYVIP
jgi:hypothetical protein